MARLRKGLLVLSVGVIIASLILWAMTLTGWRGISLKLAPPPAAGSETPDQFRVTTQRGAIEFHFAHFPQLADSYAAREGLLRTRLDALEATTPADEEDVRLTLAVRQSLAREIAVNIRRQKEAKATGFSVGSGQREDRLWPSLYTWSDGTNRVVELTLPFWLIVLLALAISIILTLPWLRSDARRRKGLCPACGYDLRTTPARCPECGHQPTATPSPPIPASTPPP